jgi:hypothetical protein
LFKCLYENIACLGKFSNVFMMRFGTWFVVGYRRFDELIIR